MGVVASKSQKEISERALLPLLVVCSGSGGEKRRRKFLSQKPFIFLSFPSIGITLKHPLPLALRHLVEGLESSKILINDIKNSGDDEFSKYYRDQIDCQFHLT